MNRISKRADTDTTIVEKEVIKINYKNIFIKIKLETELWWSEGNVGNDQQRNERIKTIEDKKIHGSITGDRKRWKRVDDIKY